METALHLALAWFGLGAIGTVILLGARTLVRRSEPRRECSRLSDPLVAEAQHPGEGEVLKRAATADLLGAGGSVAIRKSTSTDRNLQARRVLQGRLAVETANLQQSRCR